MLTPVMPEARLRAELDALHAECAGLQGAAVASGDGLALCATGLLGSDTASAAAAFLLGEIDVHLTMLRAGPVREALVWTDAGPWYLTRVGRLHHVLLLCASETPAAVLRHAGALACARIEPLLASLTEHA